MGKIRLVRRKLALKSSSGGIRGIVELEVLQTLESMIGVKIPIHQFFDLIVGTRYALVSIVLPYGS